MAILQSILEQYGDAAEHIDDVRHELHELKMHLDAILDDMEDDHVDICNNCLQKAQSHSDNMEIHAADRQMDSIWDIMKNYGVEPEFDYQNDCEISEGSKVTVAYRREGNKIKKRFRCTTGEKKGRLVSDPMTCVKKKSLKRILAGRKIQQKVKSVRIQHAKLSAKKGTSKMVRKMNARLKHHSTRKTKDQ